MPADLIPDRGAIAAPLRLEVARELTPDDLLRLADAPKSGVPVLKRARAIHHRQALLLAEGRPVAEVAMIVGCTAARLVQLQNDPTFQELMHYYTDQLTKALFDDAERLKHKILDLGEMAVDELHARMEDEGQRAAMPTGEVRKLAEFAMDRTVAPPKSAAGGPTMPEKITINFGTALKSTPEDKTKTIEGQVAVEAEVVPDA